MATLPLLVAALLAVGSLSPALARERADDSAGALAHRLIADPRVVRSAGGTFYCSPGLCAPAPARPGSGSGRPPSEVRVALEVGTSEYEVACRRDREDGPSCAFTPAEAVRAPRAAAIPADTFIVPGDGCLYAVRSSGSTHAARHKYCPAKEGALREVGTGLSAVGFHGVLTREVALRERPAADAPVFHAIAPYHAVAVILSTRSEAEDWYLLRDEFGLLGWASARTLRIGPDHSLIPGFGLDSD